MVDSEPPGSLCLCLLSSAIKGVSCLAQLSHGFWDQTGVLTLPQDTDHPLSHPPVPIPGALL